jgi:ubiquinone/menaquinone biosynthesis C-methylase UbiE
MQKDWYERNSDDMNQGNHSLHNLNPDYWYILLNDAKDKRFEDKVALDFGCGCGRNLINLLRINKWKKLIGVDISSNNLLYTKNNIDKQFPLNITNVELYCNNGIDLKEIKDNSVDFAMSTIVLEHICIWEIRYNILKEIYRVLNEDGLFSFQMGYDPNEEKLNKDRMKDYHDNFYEATGTNSNCDNYISDPNQIVNDLKEIGFKNISYEIRPPFSSGHQYWIFIKGIK